MGPRRNAPTGGKQRRGQGLFCLARRAAGRGKKPLSAMRPPVAFRSSRSVAASLRNLETP